MFIQNGFKAGISIYMEIGFPVQQPVGTQKSEKSEDMVAMKMGNEYVVYFPKTQFVFSELDLGAFTAIHQEKPLMHIDSMSGWKSSGCGNSRAAPKYG